MAVTRSIELRTEIPGPRSREILERKKRGFGAPFGAWLKRDLQPMMRRLLSKQAVESRGLFHWPVIEETMFRGALFHHLRRRWSWVISAPVVAFIFAVIHPQGWVTVPALGAIAMVLAALREWRGSIVAPMAAHACNNFIVLTFALLALR